MIWKTLITLTASTALLGATSMTTSSPKSATPSAPESWASAVADDFVSSWISGRFTVCTCLLADSLLKSQYDLVDEMNFVTSGHYNEFTITDSMVAPSRDEYRFSGTLTGELNGQKCTAPIVVRVANDNGKFRVSYFQAGERQRVPTP